MGVSHKPLCVRVCGMSVAVVSFRGAFALEVPFQLSSSGIVCVNEKERCIMPEEPSCVAWVRAQERAERVSRAEQSRAFPIFLCSELDVWWVFRKKNTNARCLWCVAQVSKIYYPEHIGPLEHVWLQRTSGHWPNLRSLHNKIIIIIITFIIHVSAIFFIITFHFFCLCCLWWRLFFGRGRRRRQLVSLPLLQQQRRGRSQHIHINWNKCKYNKL